VKLLYLHSGEIDSGMANAVQVVHMCSAFVRAGIEVRLAVPGTDAEAARRTIAAQTGHPPEFDLLTFRKRTVFGRLQMIGGYLGVKRLLAAEPADVCFVRNPVFLNAPLLAGIPTVFEAHNASIHRNAAMNAFWKRRLIGNARHEMCVAFVSISQALTDFWVRSGVPETKTLALHDAVDAQHFAEMEERQSARRALGLPEDRKTVVYTGSLYQDRGIENILELAETFSDPLFVVVGGPEDRRELYQALCRRRGITNVLLTGRVPHKDVRRYLFAGDVLLMLWSRDVPTIEYCSPLKTFEYMAAGRIIVGHGFPTIREVLTDGEDAFLADPDSLADLRLKLAAALERSYPDPMAENARSLAFSRYTWDARVRTILSFIRAATERN
jgi:glycosyltransferase involved in cell wall biosynthesis